jgi:serine/threonine-protein kinase HipA
MAPEKSPRASRAEKAVPGLLQVHMDRSDGVHHVGELLIDDQAPGGFAARFRYVNEWLERGFPIDPINLPLREGWVETGSKYLRLGVLFDAGPDMWGRRVLQSSGEGDSGGEHRILVLGRGNGVGALLFAETPDLARRDLPEFETLPTVETDLERVHEAAHRVFSTAPLPDHLQGLLAGSWSIGGARAKAVMRNLAGEIWIAKFSEPDDRYDRQRCELANLRMAREIGLEVPDCQVVDTSRGSVFLIKRFDRTPDLQRLHYASAISLVSAEPEDKRLNSPIDRATFSYARIADVISRISPDPARERQELFARMAFNVCVRNTDDHLKNLGFVESPEVPGRGLMRLAPVFDVVTQSAAQHYLHIGLEGRVGSIANVLSDPGHFRLSAKGAAQIVERVVEVVSRRRGFYAEVGLPEADMAMLDELIAGRCPAG